MLRVLFTLFDGVTIRHLGIRIVFTVLGLGALLMGLLFLLAAGYQALASVLDALDASLIYAAVFVFFALGCLSFASLQWRRRPRPLLAHARLGVVAEMIAIAQNLIRREPAKAVVAALVLGAITEYLNRHEAGASKK